MLPSTPRGPSPLAGGLGFVRDAPGFLERMAREHGDVVAVPIGPLRTVLINHPDLIHQVLVTDRERYVKAGMARGQAILGSGLLTSEGDFHDRQRRLARGAFDEAPLAGYLAAVPALVERRSAGWRAGDRLDLATAMLDITGRVITRAMFGPADGSPVDDADADLVTSDGFEDEMAADLTEAFAWLNLFPEPLQALDRLPLPAQGRMRRARARLGERAEAGIARRKGRPAADLLGWLLAGRDDDGTGMTDDAAADEVRTLLVAAHEPTAMALTWTWWLLGGHPAARARLEAELDATLGDGRPTPGDLARLPFTAAVVRESLRLYPPVWIFARQPVADTTLGGYAVAAGTWVFLSPYVTQRDPRFHPDPAAFRPERWLDDGAATPDAGGAYFPFGRGERTCIGDRFARQECVLVLATLARRWRLEPVADGAPGGLRPAITLGPRRPITVTLAEREAPPAGAAARP